MFVIYFHNISVKPLAVLKSTFSFSLKHSNGLLYPTSPTTFLVIIPIPCHLGLQDPDFNSQAVFFHFHLISHSVYLKVFFANVTDRILIHLATFVASLSPVPALSTMSLNCSICLGQKYVHQSWSVISCHFQVAPKNHRLFK